MSRGAYAKALSGVEKSDPSFTVTVPCACCEETCGDTHLCLTKTAVARQAIAGGWTYGKKRSDHGAWFCPLHSVHIEQLRKIRAMTLEECDRHSSNIAGYVCFDGYEPSSFDFAVQQHARQLRESEVTP